MSGQCGQIQTHLIPSEITLRIDKKVPTSVG